MNLIKRIIAYVLVRVLLHKKSNDIHPLLAELSKENLWNATIVLVAVYEVNSAYKRVKEIPVTFRGKTLVEVFENV